MTAENVTYEISWAIYSNALRQMVCYKTVRLTLKFEQFSLSYRQLFFRIFYPYTHLSKALRYKMEVHGFDSRRCHWNFSLT